MKRYLLEESLSVAIGLLCWAVILYMVSRYYMRKSALQFIKAFS